MKFERRITCVLRHGVHLEITDRTGDASPKRIADMLAVAMARFKAEREHSGYASIDGKGFGAKAKDGNKIQGSVSYSCEGKVLPVACWVEAAIEAYVSANTVEQIYESLSDWKVAAEKDGGYLREVVLLLEKSDVLAAIATMIEHNVKKGPP